MLNKSVDAVKFEAEVRIKRLE